ncbi:conserved protein, unknown function, partial [Hepatocystis sp. ex Piliocolobus tephrosceles]
KCALLENKTDTFVLEEKYKKLEIILKDMENEKSIFERACLKNEKIQEDMSREIKDLKNELYECKSKLYTMNKANVYNETNVINHNKKDYNFCYKNEIDKDGLTQHNAKVEQEEITKNFEMTEKISFIEKQLMLLKLEKTSKESELIRCPKYGRKNEEIKKKEFLEKKLQYLDDKINYLNKNLKYIKL